MDTLSVHNKVAWALAYARRGWRVFPLHTVYCGDCTCGRDACSSMGKHPRTKNGVKDATTDPAQIRQWWDFWPIANIGIATGDGLYVIDVDTSKGARLDSLNAYGLASLLDSPTVQTGSGGYHIYLSCDPTLVLPNTTNKLGPHIDTRGSGGYVVAPPSLNKYGMYQWQRRGSDSASLVAPMPPELLKTLLPAGTTYVQPEEVRREILHEMPVTPQTQSVPDISAPAKHSAPAATGTAVQEGVAQEARNVFLTSMAGVLRGRGLQQDEICAMLLALNGARYGGGRHPQGPLPLKELQHTIFKSVEKWQLAGGVLASDVPVVTDLHRLINSELPETAWIVPQLLTEGLILLAGKPKMGKSWLALGLALACALGSAQGAPVLNCYPVEPMGVLYLSLEDSANRFRSRASKLLGAHPTPERFGYALHWKPLLSGGLADLDAYLMCSPDTRLVLIDTLARVRTSGSGNGSVYQEDYALMSALHDLTMRHHIALILVHHTRKQGSDDPFDEISGSTGLTGAADASLVLKRARNQSQATLHVTGRDLEEQELALTFTPESGLWHCTGSVAERELSQSKQEILLLLGENESMTPKEIAAELDKPYGTTKSTLARMSKEGLIAKNERGRYSLPLSGPTLFDQDDTEID